MSYRVEKMNLFDAPRDSILVHACNCQASWNSGIAVEFKNRFPKAHRLYNQHCMRKDIPILGTALVVHDENYHIGCLFTSKHYGSRKGTPESILAETESALEYLFEEIIFRGLPREIYSNQFNSGLFNVPWEKTEEILVKMLKEFPSFNWTVCKLEQ